MKHRGRRSPPYSLNIRPKEFNSKKREAIPSLGVAEIHSHMSAPDEIQFFYDILCRVKAHAYTYVPHLVIPATRSHRHLVDWRPFSLAPLALVRHQLLLCSDMSVSQKV